MSANDKGAFYSGTSGLVLPVPNKEHYPAEFKDKSRLEYYASLFNSIEINSSFYKIPMPSTVTKWGESVPENFRFTFKLWREITHPKGLIFQENDVHRFIKTINNVGNKKACLLVQFPPSLKIHMFSQLQKLLINIQEADQDREWKIAVEFRDASWYHEDVYDLAHEFNASIVIHDKPRSATPLNDLAENFKYLRFHGPNGDYKGHYEDGFLNDYAEIIDQWNHEEKEVYCYFNNTAGDAVKNLISLDTLVTNYIN
ncbi:DUF72 domain-containing protein [Dyadobacter subterraneus]|uniref:DUF72 domain-containing protein n=1 Tax=Dyadobacter subterraneus TaxID=2773304 RepID=A0ABR9WA80_9BACT|nr:DUF72 domain-containing protein [Dyadobacter subterraneus]MBE9462365.1 DUF72 domain-containing protein [Dyadobacter subterraneus]